jgi:ribosomal protein S18 acetylase RimI-like enzyme
MGAVDDGLVIPPFRPSMGSGLGGTYAPESGGSRVGVSWDLNPRQLANRVFWVRVRSRFLELMALMDEHHPHDPAYYLLAIGVRPASQGKGVGSALLSPVLEQCDRGGEAAYLEATSERSRKLYERHGFEVIGQFAPVGGPPLWPMWRSPR